jgi:hypothetical protein
MELKSEFLKFSKVMTAIVATLGSVWFFGEPFLEDYVESHIDAYELKHKEENSKKEKLRKLLSDKMLIPQDEVHIELGRMYQNEIGERNKLYEAIDNDYNHSKDKRNKIIKEIKKNHPNTILNYEN